MTTVAGGGRVDHNLLYVQLNEPLFAGFAVLLHAVSVPGSNVPNEDAVGGAGLERYLEFP